MEWKSMETAPKDGHRFLALVNGVVRFVAWGKTSHVPLYGFCLADQGGEDFDICSPTKWRGGESIITQYPECCVDCEDSDCPYTHITTYLVKGLDNEVYGPYSCLQDAVDMEESLKV